LKMMNHDCACRWAASGMFVHQQTQRKNQVREPAILNANESRSRGCAWGVVSPEYHRLW
jgi:hypothetical protein